MIECPHCGGKDFDTFNESHNDNEYVEFCVCFDCDKDFQLIYELKEIKVV